GVSQDATISSGGHEILSAGSSFLGTIGSGASEAVFSGGYASKETVSGIRALLTVRSGGFAGGTIIADGGQQQIFAGGSAGAGTDPPLTVNPTTRTTTVNSGGSEFIFSRGVPSGTVVHARRFQGGGIQARAR